MTPLPPPAATVEERRHLAEAHHELCTSLTSLRSNLELARRHAARRESAEAIAGRLREMEDALERLERLARAFRTWHGPPVTTVTRTLGPATRGTALTGHDL